jgi:adenylosuccinate synthase
MIKIVLGAQWGDEGKGKFTDYFSQDADLCIRFQGGNNAGHTIKINDRKFKLRMIPSGIITGTKCIIGAGTAVNLDQLEDEVNNLKDQGIKIDETNLLIDERATLVIPFIYPEVDTIRERLTGNPIGTTKNGIGIAYEDKAARIAIRAADIVNINFPLIKKITTKYAGLLCHAFYDKHDMENTIIKWCIDKQKVWQNHIKNCTGIIYHAIKEDKNVIIEGAQGAMLDNTLGTYPYVTSSCTTIGGVMQGIGCSIPLDKSEIVGIVKAYCTRVGNGPFDTELPEDDVINNTLVEKGNEFGTVTGRKRRCGWLDLDQLVYTNMINGYTCLALTKADVMCGLEKVVIKYSDKEIKLSGWQNIIDDSGDINNNFSRYIDAIQDLTGIKVKYISYSPDREDIIVIE